ncbi:MAG: acyl-protein synthetase LuxE [Paenibacillaceae bacterium]|jgi:phenylacetate-coenzyme A ligase PaaK-like adenylate-forming protein|nr:acyl-protein synthetase LuxE [Paenibacillaceae bacterium]
MRPESRAIVAEILQFMDRFADVGDRTSHADERLPSGTPADLELAFNELALKLFRYHFQSNPPYRKYCQARRKTPLTVREWQDIPPLPIQAFKELTLSCEPVDEAEAVFMTSGTTNADKRGKNFHPTLEVWDASMVPPFKRFVLPDRERMMIYVLSPGKDLNSNSSLSRYLSMAVEHFGTKDSRFFFKPETGLDMEELVQSLRTSELRGEPVLLMGASFSYVHLIDYCDERGIRFSLPAGSRVFDTGGLKGRSREITTSELYEAVHRVFAVNRNHCLNMYGMTELSSQMYDLTIRSCMLSGRAIHDKAGPAWVRTRVLDPDTLEPVRQGETGVLAHYDLANWNSAVAILTEDIGVQTEAGLVLQGRAEGSEARGCSLAIDQLMRANRYEKE